MSTEFDRPLYGYRFAEILFGDSLQTIAARELGDAARWTDLIAYNKLVPPFITTDPAQERPGVLLAGRLILVPAPSPIISSTTNPDEVFEADVRLVGHGQIGALNGDFDVLTGRENLRQALKNRIETDRGELIFHSEYGSDIRRVVGHVSAPTATLLAAQYAKASVLEDPRISRVTNAVANVAGDVVGVTVDAEVVAGRSISITANP